MCFFIGEIRWRRWKPDEEYLDRINGISTVKSLVSFMKGIEYKWDITTLFGKEVFWDRWQMPDVSAKTMQGDCEDAAILAVDIYGRNIKTDGIMLITGGKYKKDNKICLNAHAVMVMPNNGYDVISNNQYFTGFKTLEDIGLKWYPEGIIYQKKFDWKGNRI